MNRKNDRTEPGAEELRARKVKLAEGGIVFALVLGLCVYLGLHFAQPGDQAGDPTASVTPPAAGTTERTPVRQAPVATPGATGAADVAATAAAASADGGTEPAAADPAPAGGAGAASVQSKGSGGGDAAAPSVAEILPDIPQVVTYSGAESAYHAGRYTAAAAMFAVYCAEHPTNAWGHYMHGLSLRRAGQLQEARAALQTALEHQDDHLKSLINLARVELDLGDAAAALAASDQALDRAPDHGPALRVRGRALHELGRTAEAEQAYRSALARDPQDGWALNNLALLWLEQEQFDRALAPLARASELLPQVAVIRNNLGVALERTGHPADAAAQYALAADLGSAHGERSALRLEEAGAASGEPTLDLTVVAADWSLPGAAPDAGSTPQEAVAAVDPRKVEAAAEQPR
jgi:tetratricopeptide (TPR) repeat protein